MIEIDLWRHLTGRAGHLAGRLAQIQSELVELGAELLSTKGWAGDGVRSPEHFLQVFTGLSPQQCAEVMRVAERSEDLCAVRTMMDEGRLSLDQAAVIAEHVPNWALEQVAPMAEATTVTQLRRVVSKYPFEREQPQYEEPRRRPDQRQPEFSMTTAHGQFSLRVRTNAVDGALIEQAIREAKDALFVAGNDKATLADGLAEVASRSLAAVESPTRREHYKVMLHLATDGHGWLERRGSLPGRLMDAFTCDGAVRPVWESDGHAVSVGRALRIVPDRTRRLVEDRDSGCRFPGCGTTRHLDNHHIIAWQHGGPTDVSNLVSLCSRHHRDLHAGGFAITGDPGRPDGLEFRNAWGMALGRSRPAAPTAARAGPESVEHPPPDRSALRGERLSLKDVCFRHPVSPRPG